MKGHSSASPAASAPTLLKASLMLFAITLCVHHPLLWIDHILWDEVSFYKMALEGDLAGKVASLAEQGIGSAYYYYAFFSWFHDPLWTSRAASLASIWAIAAVLYSIFANNCRLPSRWALGAAAVMITYPAYQMYANAGAAIYVISLGIFFLGVSAYVRGAGGGPGRHRYWLVAAAALWTISFTQQWLLVWFYAFFAAIGISRRLQDWQTWWRATPDRWQRARLHGIFLLVPPLYYYSQRAMFPLTPYFGSYSVPRANLEQNFAALAQSVVAGINVPFQRLSELPLAFWIVIGIGAAVVALRRKGVRQAIANPESPAVPPPRLILVGCGLLFAAWIPFVVTGKPAALDGPETRFSILVAPSLAVIAAGLLAVIHDLPSVRVRRALAAAGGLVLAGFAAQHARIYVDWQGCAIKDRAIVAAMQKHRPPPAAFFFVIRGKHLEHTYTRRHYDWGRIMYDAWGGDTRVGEQAERCEPVVGHYQTPLGFSRDKVADFRRWMGYGEPGPPDDWCVIDFEFSPDFDFHENRIWQVVRDDTLHRLGFGRESRSVWLSQFILKLTVSPPLPFALSAGRLPAQKFQWVRPFQWQPLATTPLPTAEPSHYRIHRHESTTGTFSIMPLGSEGFAIRCDTLPSGGEPAVLNLHVSPTHSNPEDQPGNHGFACDYRLFGSSRAPKLLWITSGDQFVAGLPPRTAADSVEAWTAAPPVRAWFVWSAQAAGEMLQVRRLREGFLPAEQTPPTSPPSI